MTETRRAVVTLPRATRDKDIDFERWERTIQSYLPANYSAALVGDEILISGHDNAGWTLDGYVIPRLQSGLHAVRELS